MKFKSNACRSPPLELKFLALHLSMYASFHLDAHNSHFEGFVFFKRIFWFSYPLNFIEIEFDLRSSLNNKAFLKLFFQFYK